MESKTIEQYYIHKKKSIDEIEKYLIHRDADFSEIYDGPVNNTIVISVDYGDWKHSHQYLDNVMDNIGYNKVTENVTNDDGSDCYSSEHIFMFASKETIAGLFKLFAS